MSAEMTRSILVVEDDHIDAEYILKTLSKFDVKPEVFPRSYEAIAFLQRADAQRPALVLLDWKISGGGASVLRAVRQTPAIATICAPRDITTSSPISIQALPCVSRCKSG